MKRDKRVMEARLKVAKGESIKKNSPWSSSNASRTKNGRPTQTDFLNSNSYAINISYIKTYYLQKETGVSFFIPFKRVSQHSKDKK